MDLAQNSLKKQMDKQRPWNIHVKLKNENKSTGKSTREKKTSTAVAMTTIDNLFSKKNNFNAKLNFFINENYFFLKFFFLLRNKIIFCFINER